MAETGLTSDPTSQTTGRRLTLLRPLLAVAVGLALALGVLVYLGFVWPSEGPLGNSAGNGAGGNARPGDSIALVYQLPNERLSDPIELGHIELLNTPRRFRVGEVGIVPCPPPSTDCAPAAVDTWPPSTGEVEPLAGHLLVQRGNPHIVVELKVPRGIEGVFRVRGATLTYTQGLRRFRTELGPVVSLHVEGR